MVPRRPLGGRPDRDVGTCRSQWASLVLAPSWRCPTCRGHLGEARAAFRCGFRPAGPRAPRGPRVRAPPPHAHILSLLLSFQPGLSLAVFGSAKPPLLPLTAAVMGRPAFRSLGPSSTAETQIPLLQIINLVPYCITSEKAFWGGLPPPDTVISSILHCIGHYRSAVSLKI